MSRLRQTQSWSVLARCLGRTTWSIMLGCRAAMPSITRVTKVPFMFLLGPADKTSGYGNKGRGLDGSILLSLFPICPPPGKRRAQLNFLFEHGVSGA
jgi:hypothetical protein